jgi:hypothetical protein
MFVFIKVNSKLSYKNNALSLYKLKALFLCENKVDKIVFYSRVKTYNISHSKYPLFLQPTNRREQVYTIKRDAT